MLLMDQTCANSLDDVVINVLEKSSKPTIGHDFNVYGMCIGTV